jgi:hypothetical protein
MIYVANNNQGSPGYIVFNLRIISNEFPPIKTNPLICTLIERHDKRGGGMFIRNKEVKIDIQLVCIDI